MFTGVEPGLKGALVKESIVPTLVCVTTATLFDAQVTFHGPALPPNFAWATTGPPLQTVFVPNAAAVGRYPPMTMWPPLPTNTAILLNEPLVPKATPKRFAVVGLGLAVQVVPLDDVRMVPLLPTAMKPLPV